jgi:hypothetical protein
MPSPCWQTRRRPPPIIHPRAHETSDLPPPNLHPPSTATGSGRARVRAAAGAPFASNRLVEWHHRLPWTPEHDRAEPPNHPRNPPPDLHRSSTESIATSAYRPTPFLSLSPPLLRKELGNPQLFRLSAESDPVWPEALNPPWLTSSCRAHKGKESQQSAALSGSLGLSANGPIAEIPRPQIPLDLVGPKSDVS